MLLFFEKTNSSTLSNALKNCKLFRTRLQFEKYVTKCHNQNPHNDMFTSYSFKEMWDDIKSVGYKEIEWRFATGCFRWIDTKTSHLF